MNTPAWALLGAGAVIAAVDWWAVARDRRRVEYAAKPATMLALVAVALSLDGPDAAARAWFVAALGASLLGDVFLMLPSDRFVEGLASFLLAHVAYIGGIVVAHDPTAAGTAVGALAVVVVAVPLGRRILRGVRAGGHARLVGPVLAYVVVISAMVAVALGSGAAWAASGAVLFYASDGLIGWTRFVGAIRHGRVLVMVTYHLGQAGLVLSLLSAA